MPIKHESADDVRAAEILKEVKPFVEEGVGSHIIIKGLKAARDLVCQPSAF
jgi:chaperonin GroEL (HSP60 family)